MAQNKNSTVKKILSACVVLVLIPLTAWLGVWLFADRKYNIISIGVALLSCVPFFIRFEKGKSGSREMVIIAVMTSLSVIGRLIFTPIPAFKPVSAIVIITGTALGPEAGFMVGSLSAIVSNIFFGQGPWTPFQMFVWGFIGFFAGAVFRKSKKPNKIAMSLMGVIGGMLFSLMMDIWTTLSIDGTFIWTRYLASVAASFPVMTIYAVSNVIFLLILARPFLEKLNRIKIKYCVFDS